MSDSTKIEDVNTEQMLKEFKKFQEAYRAIRKLDVDMGILWCRICGLEEHFKIVCDEIKNIKKTSFLLYDAVNSYGLIKDE